MEKDNNDTETPTAQANDENAEDVHEDQVLIEDIDPSEFPDLDVGVTRKESVVTRLMTTNMFSRKQKSRG